MYSKQGFDKSREQKSIKVWGCKTTAVPQKAFGQQDVNAGSVSGGSVPLLTPYTPFIGHFMIFFHGKGQCTSG